jgi:hypothetical protein
MILSQVSQPSQGREVCCILVGAWLQSLPVNETTSAAAKSATLHGALAFDRTLGSDISAFLHRGILSLWQDEWANTQGNRLRMVKPSVQS